MHSLPSATTILILFISFLHFANIYPPFSLYHHSYQIEGAHDQDGRGPSIWDTFCAIPGKIADGSDGSTACNSYHEYEADVALLKSMQAKAYRFSISWSRIIPEGGRNDPINPAGLAYYNRLVDALLAADIIPMITLFHWDLPQTLMDRYGGMLDKEEFVADYVQYARVVFEELADRVKWWITFNEPWCSSVLGFNDGLFAPGRTSNRSKSAEGDSAREVWIAGFNIMLAHAAAVKMFREEFKPKFGGQIAITLNGK